MANVQKRILYVGGIEEGVTKEILHAAFIPFGDLLDVQVPQDHATQKNRGFGFVEFEDADDAKAAMDNMNRAELYGRVLTVNVAKPMKPTSFNKPVWAEADEWWKKTLEERGTDFETNDASEADMVPRGADQ